MPTTPVTIRAVINGADVGREHILSWESRRLPRAARKIGLIAPSDGTLARQRDSFVEAKLALGPDEIRRRLRLDTRLSDLTARTTTVLSGGRRTMSVCDLHVTGGSAEQFLTWFTGTNRTDYARSMIAAHPDHFLIDTAPDGRQEVVETTGGSPVATRFFVDYDGTVKLATPPNAAATAEAAGVNGEAGPVTEARGLSVCRG